MTKTLRSLVAALACLAPFAVADDKKPGTDSNERPKMKIGTRVGEKIPHFRADVWDVTGEKPAKKAFDSHATGTHVAYVFMSRTCPFCDMYKGRLAKMEKAYAAQGIRFVMVYPTRKTPADQKIAYHRSAGFGASMINDKDASIAKVLAITKTPEVVLATEQGEIVFRGGIDDSPKDEKSVRKNHLGNACDAVAAGRKVKVTSAPLYG